MNRDYNANNEFLMNDPAYSGAVVLHHPSPELLSHDIQTHFYTMNLSKLLNYDHSEQKSIT